MLTRAAFVTLTLAGLMAPAGVALAADPAGAPVVRHRHHHHHHHPRHGMHAWCRADAAQMMGIRRAQVLLEPQVLRRDDGRFELRGLADHGYYGQRSFTCHFDTRGVLQGAV